MILFLNDHFLILFSWLPLMYLNRIGQREFSLCASCWRMEILSLISNIFFWGGGGGGAVGVVPPQRRPKGFLSGQKKYLCTYEDV